MTTHANRCWIQVIAAAVLGALLAGCSASRPSVSISNESDAMLGARIWVGQRGTNETGSRRSARVVEIKPGSTKQFWVSETAGFVSAAESYVQAEVWTIDASFEPSVFYWYEILPPAPYSITITGTRDSLEASRNGDGRVIPVPREMWIQSGYSGSAANP
ncbi:MAG: hypothetical protein KF745_14880 [Phycisphaeraceae bacterium]|nr:hypothetical protein [Phycisphaeraceae bacterium]